MGKREYREHIEINNYWLERFDFLEEDYPTCFVCGKVERLEKCHMIPKALGGSDTVDNLVLLCNEHHREAEKGKIDREYLFRLSEEREEGKI